MATAVTKTASCKLRKMGKSDNYRCILSFLPTNELESKNIKKQYAGFKKIFIEFFIEFRIIVRPFLLAVDNLNDSAIF